MNKIYLFNYNFYFIFRRTNTSKEIREKNANYCNEIRRFLFN